MLQSTFIHLPGISEKTERRLWSRGIRHWDELKHAYPDLLAFNQLTLFEEPEYRSTKRVSLKVALAASYEAFEREDADYFASKLPPSEHYRIALSFPQTTAFLDIETTGLSHYYDETTLVGVSIGNEYRAHIKGRNSKDIREFLSRAKCLVTFNGKIFDLKFLRNDLPELKMPASHVDLRFFCKRAGLSGGQKAIEKILDVKRGKGIEEIIGEKAPMLWHDYKLGDIESAKSLIRYNHADVEGMKWIFDAIVECIWKDHSFFNRFEPHRFSDNLSRVSWASKRSNIVKNRVYVPRFRGRKGLKIGYKNLVYDQKDRNLRIVGIDLTGSEKRPTGWCLLEGATATTRQVSTDKEIVNATLEAQANLVSIDSPLSLPKGRKRESDDDPGRDRYGIMRICERELKRRGVNVYPSLIPSMQKLTARGRKLASRFRKLGIPVIESYPGAAQDIMGIPRKQKGLIYLKKGLKDFGLSGNFLTEEVSHDELDAVTSAVVGLFFWAGKFEGLGNESEDYLIIPDLQNTPDRWRRRSVVGMSGLIAAGKTTAGKYFEKQGFRYGRYSAVLTARLEKRGIMPNRENLQRYGDNVSKRKNGQRWLGNRLIDMIGEQDFIVIDGLRFPEDHAFLVEKYGPGFTHFFIETRESIREKRFIGRGGDKTRFEDASNQPVEAKVKLLKRLAHTTTPNNDTKKAFFLTLSGAINGENNDKWEN